MTYTIWIKWGCCIKKLLDVTLVSTSVCKKKPRQTGIQTDRQTAGNTDRQTAQSNSVESTHTVAQSNSKENTHTVAKSNSEEATHTTVSSPVVATLVH